MLSLLQLSFYAVPEEDEGEMMHLDLPDFLWQERCEKRFGLCKEYWNLPWTEDVTSAPERYFSLKEGYEGDYNYAFLGDDDEFGQLANRITHSHDILLLQDVRDFFAQRRDKREKAGQAKRLFRAALASGKEEYVDEMVHQMYIWSEIWSLPKIVAEVVRPTLFTTRFSSSDYIMPGRREKVFSSSDLIESIKGGNLRIVLYIQEHCSKRNESRELVGQLYKSYVYSSNYGMRNPQGFYSILQYLHERYQGLYKLETLNKDHLLFALNNLSLPQQEPGGVNVNQERVLRKNAFKSLTLARAFASYLTLDILNLLKGDKHRKSMREFAQERLDKGEYLRGPIIYGGDVSNKNLSMLPPGLKLG
jgi:hypothetical protein